MPFTEPKTITIAGTLSKYSFNMPVPCPPVDFAHDFQVISEIVMLPVVHPIVIVAGRTCVVDPGPQDSTAGPVGAVVEVVEDEVVVDTCAVVEEPVPIDFAVGDDDLEPTITPIPIPAARAATMSVTMPERTTVLRRMVMTRGSLGATGHNGTSRRCPHQEWRSSGQSSLAKWV
jgi:hypothetical protein